MKQDDPLVRYLEHRTRRRFAALVRETRGAVLAAAYRVLGDRDLAEDVTQEVFVDLLTVKWKPEEVRCGRALLASSAILAARAKLRGEARRTARDRRAMEARAPSGGGPTPDALVDLRDAVLALPDSLRECVELRYFGGLSLDEVSEALGCAIRTTNERLRAARESLRARLGAPASLALLPVITGDSDGSLPSVEASADLLRRLDRIGADGPSFARLASGRSATRAKAVLSACGVAGLLLSVGAWQLFRAGPKRADESLVVSSPSAAASGERETSPFTTNPGAASVDIHPSSLADPAPSPSPSPAEASATTLFAGFEIGEEPADAAVLSIEVVGERGERLHDGEIRLSPHVFTPLQKLEELQGYRHLLEPQPLAAQNPLELRELPEAAHDLRLVVTAVAPGLAPSADVVVTIEPHKRRRVRIVLTAPRFLPVIATDRFSGRPISGLRIVSTTELDRRGVSLGAALRESGPGSALTGDDGRAVIEGLGSGSHALEACARGYRTVVVEEVIPPQTLRLRLDPLVEVGAIVAHVTDPRGAPVEGIGVDLMVSGQSAKISVATDANGAAAFEDVVEGAHIVSLDVSSWIRASAANGWAALSDKGHLAFSQSVHVSDREETRIDLGYVRGTSSIAVEITDASDRPRHGVSVSLQGPCMDVRETNADGHAVFSNLPAGTYGVVVGAEHVKIETRPAGTHRMSAGGDERWFRREKRTLSDGESRRLRFVLGGATVCGRVVADADGRPIEDAYVMAIADWHRATHTDSDGSFSICEVPRGTYSVVAGARGFASARASVEVETLGDPASIEIRMHRGGRVLVRFRDSDRAAMRGVRLRLQAARDGEEVEFLASPSSEWDRLTPQIGPGAYTLTTEIPGRTPRSTIVQVRDGADTIVEIGIE